MGKIKIVRASERYAESYCYTMDSVAREGKFLSVSKGYPLPQIINFIKICRDSGYPQYFLINEENEAVGWCDIVIRNNQPADVGYLGIGIMPQYRGQGWGTKLMAETIHCAMKYGFNEIRLEVRASNENAIHTYKKLGFVFIEYTRNGVTTDGVSEDVWLMSLGARDIENGKFDRNSFFKKFPQIKYKFTH